MNTVVVSVTSEAREQDTSLAKKAQEVFSKHKRRYVARRIHVEMQFQGERVGLHKVRKLMGAECLQAIQPRSFVPKTTVTPRGLSTSVNLILKEESISELNQVWVGDITHIPLSNGKYVYLAS